MHSPGNIFNISIYLYIHIPFYILLSLYCAVYLSPCSSECRFKVQNAIMTFYERARYLRRTNFTNAGALTIFAEMWGHPRAEFLHVKTATRAIPALAPAAHLSPDIRRGIAGSSENPFLPGSP